MFAALAAVDFRCPVPVCRIQSKSRAAAAEISGMNRVLIFVAALLLLSICFGHGNNIRRRATAPEEDLTAGVPKTEAKDAKKIHTKLEESSKRVKSIKIFQDKARTETKNVVITNERASSIVNLISTMPSIPKMKALLTDAVDDKGSLRKTLEACHKLIDDNDKCIRQSQKEECKELEIPLQKAMTALLGYAKDRFKLPVKNLRDFDDAEREEKEKRESKKAEEKQKEADRVEEESRKKEHFERKEQQEKLNMKKAEEASKASREEAKKARDRANKREQAEKAAQKASIDALEAERRSIMNLRKAEKAKREEEVKMFEGDVKKKKESALKKSKALAVAQKKQAEAKEKSDALRKQMEERKKKEKKTIEENEKAGEQRKKVAAAGEKRLSDLNNGISEMMKKQQELLSRKMTLQNDMASNMKSAEEKMKKDHAEYRKKAETKASAAADKQVKDMKEIMDGFIKKLAANMPKTQVPVPTPVANAAPASSDVSIKKPNGDTSVAVPGTTLHIECNGCGGNNNNAGEHSSETSLKKETNEDKEIDSKHHDLETKVATAVDHAVNKIVGIHKSNNAGRTLVGDPELDKTKATVEAQKKELEAVKSTLEKQKEMNNHLTQKNLEKDRNFEQLSNS